MIRVTVDDDTPELFGKLEKAISRFVRKGITHIEGEIKSSIAEPKSGLEYKRGDKVHVASAPGESPASDSSNYLNSIGPAIFESTLEAKVGTPLEYPIYLEEETEDIAERPLWEKTQQEVLPTLETLLANEIGK